MNHLKIKNIFCLTLIALMSLSACTSTPSTVTDTKVTATEVVDLGSSPANSTAIATSESSTISSPAQQPTASEPALIETHESEGDYSWDETQVVEITLADDASSATSQAVSIVGNQIIITANGTYRLSGKLSDGQILVESANDGMVQLILNGVDINSNSSAPIYLVSAEKTVIVLADGTQNILTDTTNYIFASEDEDEPKATLFSNDDLTITGNGSLIVIGHYNDAVSTDDGLLINATNLNIQAVDDGIRGKDYLVITNASLEIVAGGDGLKSDSDDAEKPGQIQISDSMLTIESVGDAVSAEGTVAILSGEIIIHSGDSSFNPENDSAKGIKGLISVVIEGGTFFIDAVDDGLHSNGDITINDGTFMIASGDDGIHSDLSLTINGGTIDITESYEGLESQVVTVNGGEISLIASDDGINSAGDTNGSGMNGGWGMPGGQAPLEMGGNIDDYWVHINGGKIYVNAGGDGVDTNGSIDMTGGLLLVDGPISDRDALIDYTGSFEISGGTLVAAGSLGMTTQAPSTSSTQASIFLGLDQVLPASTLINLQTNSGYSLLTYAPSKQYQSVLVSSPDIEVGETYTMYLGGLSSGEIENNLYINGEYQPGTQLTLLTVESTVTTYGTLPGSGGGGFPGGGFPPGGGGRRP
jgi:hypothetical protein